MARIPCKYRIEAAQRYGDLFPPTLRAGGGPPHRCRDHARQPAESPAVLSVDAALADDLVPMPISAGGNLGHAALLRCASISTTRWSTCWWAASYGQASATIIDAGYHLSRHTFCSEGYVGASKTFARRTDVSLTGDFLESLRQQAGDRDLGGHCSTWDHLEPDTDARDAQEPLGLAADCRGAGGDSRRGRAPDLSRACNITRRSLASRRRGSRLASSARSSRRLRALAALRRHARANAVDGPALSWPGAFWLGADDKVLAVRPVGAHVATAIAGEWAALDPAGRRRAQPTILGPIRQGSEWLVAARVPGYDVRCSKRCPHEWSVAYANLDALIAPARPRTPGQDGLRLRAGASRAAQRPLAIFRWLGHAAGERCRRRPDPLPPGFGRGHSGQLPAARRSGPTTVGSRPRSWLPRSACWCSWPGCSPSESTTWLMRCNARTTKLAGARKRLHTVNQDLAQEMQQRLSLQETFDHARFHDAFTGLPNRRFFMDQLDRALRDLRTRRRQTDRRRARGRDAIQGHQRHVGPHGGR